LVTAYYAVVFTLWKIIGNFDLPDLPSLSDGIWVEFLEKYPHLRLRFAFYYKFKSKTQMGVLKNFLDVNTITERW
jgi:hypothetical protein